MRFLVSHRAVFWRLPWSAPLRAALSWQADPAQFPDDAPPPVAPRWLRPLCVQRLVGHAVAQRAAWLATHPCLEPYRFGRESEPDWHECNLLTYDRRNLREMGEPWLRWMLGMEVERLLRLVQDVALRAWRGRLAGRDAGGQRACGPGLPRTAPPPQSGAGAGHRPRGTARFPDVDLDNETAACTDYWPNFLMVEASGRFPLMTPSLGPRWRHRRHNPYGVRNCSGAEHADQPVRRIHHWGILRIDGRATQAYRLRARKTISTLQMLFQVAKSLAHHLPADRGRCPSAAARCRRLLVRGPAFRPPVEGLRLVDLQVFAQLSAHSRAHRRFDCRPADLAIALRRVPITHRMSAPAPSMGG